MSRLPDDEAKARDAEVRLGRGAGEGLWASMGGIRVAGYAGAGRTLYVELSEEQARQVVVHSEHPEHYTVVGCGDKDSARRQALASLGFAPAAAEQDP